VSNPSLPPSLPFVDRQYELDKLNLLTYKKTASLVVLKGRRRIGKSRLLLEFTKDHQPSYRFVGLSPALGINATHQREEFAKKLQAQFDIPPIPSDDWDDLFKWLGKLTAKQSAIIIFDEISWMAMDDPTFLPKLKNAWDEIFSQNPQLVLILCGSISTWIEQNILSSTGFFGRVASEISLEELSIPSSYQLLQALGFKGSNVEFFIILSLTGGIPWYLELINPKLSVSENIKSLCFNRDGILVKEYKKIFHDIFGKRGDIYQKIVDTLSSGPKEYAKIAKSIDYRSGGPLSNYLQELTISGFIRQDYVWNINTGKKMNISQYRLNDNYLRFYIKFIAPNLDKIINNSFKVASISSLPAWPTLMGLQFENLILHNRALLWEKLRIDPSEIINDNPYVQRQTKTRKGCQIDYLIQTKFNMLYVCECKFSENKTGSSVIQEVKNKIDRLDRQNKFVCKPVLIHVGGVTKDLMDSGYFAHIVDVNELI
jgi:hypothetical protein